MSRKRAQSKRLLAAGLLLIWFCQLTHGQNDTALSVNLTQIEQRIEQGRADEIEKPLLAYAVAHPTDSKALFLLGQVRHQQGRFAEARALYQRVLTLDPTHVRAKINLAHTLYELGQQTDARRLLVELAQSPVAAPQAQLALAQGLVLVGEFERALAAVAKLPAQAKTVDALPVLAASYLALGERQKLTALIPAMRRAAVARPVLAAQCAEVLQQAGLTQPAATLLRSVLVTAPNSSSVLLLLGRLETDARDYAQARQHLNRAAALAPRSPDVLTALAALDSSQGNLTAALASLERARLLAPDSPPLLAQFVVTAMRANQPQAAAEAANTLRRLKPDEPEFLYLFGAASLQSGNLAAAQNALERYVRERPSDLRGCLALGITFAGRQEQPAAARAQFEHCLQLDPANVEAKYQLGLISKAQGEMAQAIELLEDVTKRAPRHAHALRDLGTLYLQTSADEKARALLERAVALDPQDAETHFQLSRLYNRIGERALAQRQLELFQRLKQQAEKGTVP